MQKTKIEYLTHTWNPIAMRCARVSAGCANCWHLRMAHRLSCNSSFSNDVRMAYLGWPPILKTAELSAPLKLRKPARIGVNFMGDLFHESVTNEQIAAVFGVMAACPQHTFFVLTKRERMVEWFDAILPSLLPTICTKYISDAPPFSVYWPLPNVILGVSVEDQASADERIPWLLKTSAAKRFVSCEPLLGPIDIGETRAYIKPHIVDAFGDCKNWCPRCGDDPIPRLDWVVSGSETGPGARPCNPDWLRSIRYQCAVAGTPFFLKQVAPGVRELDGRLHEDWVEI